MTFRTSKRFSFTGILLPSLLIFLFWTACNQPADTLSDEKAPSVEGVWKQTEHFWMNEFGDTLFVAPEHNAQKIYLDGHVMWNCEPDPDSTEWFGFGTYELNGDTLIERLSTMSRSMQETTEFNEAFVLVVEFDENNFRQYMESTWQDTVYYNTEVYVRLK